jgi:hypothetical protein
VLEHECADLLSVDCKRLNPSCPRADQISDGFVAFVGNPDRGELPGTKQPGQRHSIPTIGLHTVPREQPSERSVGRATSSGWRTYGLTAYA